MDIRDGLAIGLVDVEDVGDLEAAQYPAGLDVGVGLVVVARLVTTGSEDGDASFAASDLPADALPGAIAGDAGCVATLAKDEQDVRGAVVVEAGGDGEHSGPLVPRYELGERVLELAVQFAQSFGCRHGVHRTAWRRAARWASAAARMTASCSSTSQ